MLIYNLNKLNNLVNAPIVTNNESEAPQGSSSKETPLLNLSNINLVHSHFTSKLETFQSSQTLSTEFVIFRFYPFSILFFNSLTQKIKKLNQIQIIKVMETVQRHVDSLNLVKIDKLEIFERYNENPQEIPYFRQFIRTLVLDYKTIIEEKLKQNP